MPIVAPGLECPPRLRRVNAPRLRRADPLPDCAGRTRAGCYAAFLRLFLLVLVAIHLVRYWVLPAFDSLWVDESGTWWTIHGSWSEMIHRTAVHPNSRLYGALMWAWTQGAGVSEAALRAPSLLAMGGAIAVLSWWVEREVGRGAGWLLAALCVASPQLSFLGVDARPYALAVLLFAVSTVAWVRLLRVWRWPEAAVWVVSTAALVHAQAVVSLAVLSQLVWLEYRRRDGGLTPRRLLALVALAVLCLALALPEVLRVTGAVQGEYQASVADGRLWPHSWGWLLPPSVLAPAAVAAGVLAMARLRTRERWSAGARRMAAAAVAMILLSALLLAAYTLAMRTDLFLMRYAPALCLGWLILTAICAASWTTPRGRAWFAALYMLATLAASVAAQGPFTRHADADWRGAMKLVRGWQAGRPAPVLVVTGYVEGGRIRLLRDWRWQEFLQGPVPYYGHAGPTYVYSGRPDAAVREYDAGVLRRVEGSRLAAVLYSGEQGGEVLRAIEQRCGPGRLLGRTFRLEAWAFGPP